MRLHTNLDRIDLSYVMKQVKDQGLVTGDVMLMSDEPHKSRTHPRAFELQLGTWDKNSLPAGYRDQYGHKMNVRRYKNSGDSGATNEWNRGEAVWAATWHEWGWFMAAVFAMDPEARFGELARHHYKGTSDFNAKTDGVFAGFQLQGGDRGHARTA